jgi:hypothetical protein
MPVFGERGGRIRVLQVKKMDTTNQASGPAIGPRAIATASANEAVLIANTPAFLLDRLRKDVAVQYVLDSMTPPEIVGALREALARPAKEASDLVPRYVYLTALSTIDPQDQELWKQIASLDLSQLEWGEAMRRLIRAEAVPTTTLDFALSSPLRP